MFKIDLKTQETILVDWINSLDIPSCSLVDSIDDLKSGTIPLEILSYLKSAPVPAFNSFPASRQQVLANWSVFLKELPKDLKNSLSVSPEEIIKNDLKLIEAINLLSSIQKNDSSTFSALAKDSFSNRLPPRPISGFTGHKFMQQSPEKTSKSAAEAEPDFRTQKESILAWLEKLNVIRQGSADPELLMSICRTGVLYADLVNRLEGRSEVIKGIERNPKNKTQALSNINKTLEHLRSQEKMKSRFLWASKEIIEGSEESVLGLLNDIKQLYFRPKLITKTKTSPNTSFNAKLEDSPGLPASFLQEKSRQVRSYSASMRRTPTLNQTPVSISRPNSSKNIRKEVKFSLSDDAKNTAIQWIQALGIEYIPTNNPYTDPLKNGVLLCELLRILESESVKINPVPRSTKTITENLEKILQVFQRKKKINNSSLVDPFKLAENVDLVIAFVYTLMKIYPKSVSLDYQDHPLPYGALGIKKLEKSILKWIVSLAIIQPDPQDFYEIIAEIRTGVLLCVVVSKAFSVSIPSIVRDPRTELASIGNIRKGLDVLRKVPQMSQKYLYSAKEIYKGSAGVVLGLLEDMHRCADGLPARKSGDEYYKDGPYVPKDSSKPTAWKTDSFNATFGSSQSPNKSKIDCYAQWIMDQGVSLPFGISFLDNNIPEFTTGVILCSLLTSLEQRSFSGVTQSPRNKASSLQNISKALSVLKKKKGFPVELMNIEEDIFRGNGVVIRKLIQTLMKLYKE